MFPSQRSVTLIRPIPVHTFTRPAVDRRKRLSEPSMASQLEAANEELMSIFGQRQPNDDRVSHRRNRPCNPHSKVLERMVPSEMRHLCSHSGSTSTGSMLDDSDS